MGGAGLLDSRILLSTRWAFGGGQKIHSPMQSFSLNVGSAQRVSGSFCRCLSRVQRRPPPVIMTTNSKDVDVMELSALLAATKQNCELFPSVLSDGSIVPVDPKKLRHALRHSTVVVGLYVERDDGGQGDGDSHSAEKQGQVGEFDLWAAGDWFNRWKELRTVPRSLIAFGRATSDSVLTASIYDIVVSPPYQRLGLGSRVLLKIVKDLRKRGIIDIAATPSPELRPFFEQCGFGPDALESITMMYTRGPSIHTDSLHVKEAGRRALVIPPARVPFHSRL